MIERRKQILLILIMIVVSISVMLITMFLLYQTSFKEAKARMSEIAKNQARMIEAIARFDDVYSSDYPGGSEAATLSQLKEAHDNFGGFAKTGEFTLAKLVGDEIEFLLTHRNTGLVFKKNIPFNSNLARPMQLALSGESGIVLGLDYRGVMVLAAHEPVAELNIGVVAKIDLAELRLPYIKTGIMVSGIAFVFVLIGGVTFIRINEPTIRKIIESEKKLNTLFSAMNEMIVLHELVYNKNGKAIDYRVLDCNNAFTKSTGIKIDDAVGKLGSELYEVNPPPYFEEYKKVVITGDKLELNVHYQPLDKHFLISVVSPKKGQFATITTDISEIMQMQEVVSAKNKELEDYLYIASHDLRSPLVNIQGFSHRLQEQANKINHELSKYDINKDERKDIDEILQEGIPKSLNYVFTNVTKMNALINGLLKISRTGRVTMNIKKIDMSKLFKKIIESFSFQIDKISAEIVIVDLPDCYGDFNLLNQMFSNLLENSLKYKDPDKPLVITITSKTRFKKIVYNIQDTGIGMSEQYLNKIWDIFYQIHPDSSNPGEGIGLNIVKRIVDKHRGKIHVNSTENIGSTFSVELNKNEFLE